MLKKMLKKIKGGIVKREAYAFEILQGCNEAESCKVHLANMKS
jgi:hypothetical protein